MRISKQSILNLLGFIFFLYLIYTLIAKISAVGSADFFYYTLNGRDLSEGIFPGVMIYSYFPGIYWFWKFSVDIFGKDIYSLQTIYTIVLIISSILASFCTYLLTKNILGSLFSGICYIILLHLLEGTAGCIEPVASLFLLIGFISFILCSQKNWHVCSAVLLSFFLGLCLFFKQQGLFFIAASFVLPFQNIRKVYDISFLNFFSPILSVATLLLLLVLDGGGLSALQVAFSMTQTYAPEGSFFENLKYLYNTISPILLFLIALLLPSLIIFRRSFIINIYQIRIILFLFLSFLFPLYQFKIRGYLHYADYMIPSFTILVGWLIATIFNFFKISEQKVQQKVLFSTVLVTLLISILQISDVKRIYSQINNRVSEFKDNQSKLNDICIHLQSDEVLLIPPRVNAFHWVCDTKSALGKWGYSWAEESASYYYDIINNNEVRDIFVFSKSYGYYENLMLSRAEWTDLNTRLSKAGYDLVYSNSSGSLYQKK